MTRSDFASFFRALHDGQAPFPWQQLLADQVVETGTWPETIAVPTGAGKTAVMDIAVFALALEADRAPSQRRVPLRTFMVVDRRIVVDSAYSRARRMAAAIAQAREGILREVAERLVQLSGGTSREPLTASIMRGGIPRDPAWTESPVQPTICVSTVDQVGSRLLFRGYGLSEFALPIHAALIGMDSLIVLDEAHLSSPFVQTIRAVQFYEGDRWAECRVGRPLQLVQMTATPASQATTFRLTEGDWLNPDLGRRLRARKLAALVPVDVTKQDDEAEARRKLARRMVDEALRLSAQHEETDVPRKRRKTKRPDETSTSVARARVIGIVVNRVATARTVFGMLREQTSANVSEPPLVVLLTGRIRAFDRDRMLGADLDNAPSGVSAGLLHRVLATRDRNVVPEQAIFLVATQTVEVGADFDFDALVTEAAPLDALRQRFGRLDRMGLRRLSHAAIVASKQSIARNAVDPVYGTATAATWDQLQTWLESAGGRQERLDFGAAGLEPNLAALSTEARSALLAPLASAPVMMPAHVDAWCQTSPAPAVDPDVGLFLHGPDREPADVQVVWRADLPGDLTGQHEGTYVDILSVMPPMSLEAMPVPLSAARSWLRRAPDAADVSDVEGGEAPGGQERSRPAGGRLAIRWFGADDSRTSLARPEELRPGDTIVVPADYGGGDEFGWNPSSRAAVRDVADACVATARRRTVLRLVPAVVSCWQPDTLDDRGRDLKTVVEMRLRDSESADDPNEAVDAVLAIIAAWSNVPRWARDAAEKLKSRRGRKVWRYPGGQPPGCVVHATWSRDPRAEVRTVAQEYPEREVHEDDEGSWAVGIEDGVTLDQHSKGVRDKAASFAETLGLSEDHRAIVRQAAWLHDVGKLDRRFQIWLRGGDELAVVAGKVPLAKSAMGSLDRSALRRARIHAGYPPGGRHESLSAALIAQCPGSQVRGQTGVYKELLEYLVGTHHGRGRPFVPVVEDTPDTLVAHALAGFSFEGSSANALWSVDSGWADLFWRLVRECGWWGLAYLEAIVRLADQRQSAQERDR